ncbi:hypothetical protein OSTOST_03182, partial [Ostertagia ostertagi]
MARKYGRGKNRSRINRLPFRDPSGDGNVQSVFKYVVKFHHLTTRQMRKSPARSLPTKRSSLKETTSYKLVILISDGGETTCSKNKPSVDEVALAEELRRMGITFYYPTIGPNPNRNRIQSITGDPSLIFLLSEMNQLLQELKKALELLAKTSKATTRTATTATTSTSITTRTTRKTIQLPSIPRSGADTSIVFIIDFTESVESYFDAVGCF